MARDYSRACQDDLACFREYGHEGDHAYPPDAIPRPVVAVDPVDAYIARLRVAVEGLPGWRNPRYSGQFESKGLLDRAAVLAAIDAARGGTEGPTDG